MDISPTKDPAPKKRTRQKILDAAIQMFSQKGYHDTRVDDIVAASGTSKGAVYFHFTSKQDIFLALVDHLAELLVGSLAEAITREESGVMRVSAALESCLALFSRYQHLTKIFLIQAVGLGSVFEEKQLELHDRFVQIIKGYLDQAVEEGEIPAMDTEITAQAWMGAINEVIIRWLFRGEPSPERILKSLRVVLLRSIGVSEERIRRLEAESQT